MADALTPISAQSIGTNSGGDFWWSGGSSTATGSILGSFWNELSGTNARNNFNAEQALLSREFNSAEAAKNREWQERMSNTAYQRQVEDMKKAGINPAAAMLGSGASTPSGSSASSSPAQAASGGHGGILGALTSLAGPIIGKVAAAKIYEKASSARDAANATKVVYQETSRAQRALNVQKRKEADYAKYNYTKKERYAMKHANDAPEENITQEQIDEALRSLGIQ